MQITPLLEKSARIQELANEFATEAEAATDEDLADFLDEVSLVLAGLAAATCRIERPHYDA